VYTPVSDANGVASSVPPRYTRIGPSLIAIRYDPSGLRTNCVADDGPFATGVLSALKAAGLAGKVKIIGEAADQAGVAALKKALLKARVNIYDPTTVNLLSCLQNVHDAFGVWEWRERLLSIARQFGLSATRLEKHAA